MPTTTRNRPGIREVAQRLSLSVCTVSKALNGKPGVGDETRQRVLTAAKRAGYIPDRQAQVLRSGQTHRIELHLPTLVNPVYSETMRDVYRTAHRYGYEIMVTCYEHDLDLAEHLSREAVGRRSEAVLMPGGWGRRAPVEALLEAGMAVLLVNPGPEPVPKGVAVLDTDVAEGVRQLVSHLLKLGHRRPLLLGGPNWMNDIRYKSGLLRALSEAGLPETDFISTRALDGDESMRECRDAVLEAFAGGRRPATAVLATNDQGAIGALAAFSQLGLSVPRDVSVTGVDNITASQFSCPPLTTVSQTHLQLGRQAIELVIDIIKGRNARTARHVLTPQLIVRQSTGAASPATEN